MLGIQSTFKDKTDGRSRGSPQWSRKMRPKRHPRSGSPDSSKSQRQSEVGKRARTSFVGSDVSVESEDMQKLGMTRNSFAPTCPSSSDDPVKPPGNNEIVSLNSQQSKQGDGMLRVTSDKWEGTGQHGEELFKVDCKGSFNEPGTLFQWFKRKPTIEKHENCLGVYLNVGDPSRESPKEPYTFRLCCHKMNDEQIHLAAHKMPTEMDDTEGLLYVCYNKDKGGVHTLQENTSHTEPLAGHFIGATSDGELRMFEQSRYEPYTSNPFAFFYIMDLDELTTASAKRMSGEK